MRQHCRTCRNGECTPESHAAKEAEMRAKHAELTRVTVRHVAPATGPKVPGNAEHGAMLNDEGEVPAAWRGLYGQGHHIQGVHQWAGLQEHA